MALLLSLLLQIAPLTEMQRTALDTARDGEDHQEAAFVALVEHVAAWPDDPGDVAIRVDPDLEALIAVPAAARGDLCRVRGSLQQHVRLAAPHDSVVECFLRDEAGTPILVYVHAPNQPLPWARVGIPLEITGRFYKTVSAVDRRGHEQVYAAFVGAHPVIVPKGGGAGAPPALIGGLVVLGVVFGGLLIYTRRQRAAATAGRARAQRTRLEGEGDGPPLPEDPADALEELRRRSGD